MARSVTNYYMSCYGLGYLLIINRKAIMYNCTTEKFDLDPLNSSVDHFYI